MLLCKTLLDSSSYHGCMRTIRRTSLCLRRSLRKCIESCRSFTNAKQLRTWRDYCDNLFKVWKYGAPSCLAATCRICGMHGHERKDGFFKVGVVFSWHTGAVVIAHRCMSPANSVLPADCKSSFGPNLRKSLSASQNFGHLSRKYLHRDVGACTCPALHKKCMI